MEGESLINSRYWDSEPEQPRLIGEVPIWQSPRTYSPTWTPPVGLFGGHVCNPEWFTTGEPWPTTLPDTVYTSDGAPVCCCVRGYQVHANEEASCLLRPPGLECIRWNGFGVQTGRLWRVLAPSPAPGVANWQVWRSKTGLPSNYFWELPVPWDGRGTSPPFVLNPPIQPGAPVPTLTLTEIV